MKAVLLDTNAFAMTLTDDPRLPHVARDVILGAPRVAVSVISFYEIGQKVRLNKWPEMAVHVGRLEAIARGDGFELLPLTASAALASSLLEWSHRDPFDRMIAAVAQEEAMPLVSADEAFDELSMQRVWAGA